MATFNVTIYLKSGQTLVLKNYESFKYDISGGTTKYEWKPGERGTPKILRLDVDNISTVTYEES